MQRTLNAPIHYITFRQEGELMSADILSSKVSPLETVDGDIHPISLDPDNITVPELFNPDYIDPNHQFYASAIPE
jgi:hypothetical protein